MVFPRSSCLVLFVAQQASGALLSLNETLSTPRHRHPARNHHTAAVQEGEICTYGYDSKNNLAKAIRKEERRELVKESNHSIAFLDWRPVTRGHVLVLPKTCTEYGCPVSIDELSEEQKSKLFLFAREIADDIESKRKYQVDIFSDMEYHMWPSVGCRNSKHPHIHVVPRTIKRDGKRDNPVDCGYDENNGFARAIRGESQENFGPMIYNRDHAMAFTDKYPINDGHSLVVPTECIKFGCPTSLAETSESERAHLFQNARKVAAMLSDSKEHNGSSVRIYVNFENFVWPSLRTNHLGHYTCPRHPYVHVIPWKEGTKLVDYLKH